MHASTASGSSGVMNGRTDRPRSSTSPRFFDGRRGSRPVTAIGRPSIVGRGPYRVCDVPIVFEHGPMRARVSFNRAGSVNGLFITLPE